MSFPRDSTRTGIDTAGDMSGAAYNSDGSAKVEWADILSDVYDSVTGTLKTSSASGVGVVKSVKGTVTYNGAATQAIATLPAGALLLNAISVCTTAFNGTGPSPAVTVGYTSNQAVIITTCTLTAAAVTGETYSSLGTDLFSTVKKVKYYAAQTIVNGYLTAGGGATTGSLDVYLVYVQTAAGVV